VVPPPPHASLSHKPCAYRPHSFVPFHHPARSGGVSHAQIHPYRHPGGRQDSCSAPVGVQWNDRPFIDKIVTLQRRRQVRTQAPQTVAIFFDRSPLCTLALSRYLGFAPSHLLADEVDRVMGENVYEATVFFIRNQGFIHATAARQINFEDSLTFEQLHEQTYRDLGFQLTDVPPGPLADRVAFIQQTVERLQH
jgi:predicted ATPase